MELEVRRSCSSGAVQYVVQGTRGWGWSCKVNGLRTKHATSREYFYPDWGNRRH
jgi:hypothetical protein